jgi:hypothetical protein
MSSRFATKAQKEADNMDARLYHYVEEAHANGWHDVVKSLDQARNALLPLMHPDDRKIASAS